MFRQLPNFLVRRFVDANVGISLEVRLEGYHHIRVKESAGKVPFRVLDGVEAVDNLDILVPDQEFLRLGAGNVRQEGSLIFLVHLRSG